MFAEARGGYVPLLGDKQPIDTLLGDKLNCTFFFCGHFKKERSVSESGISY